MPQRRQAFILTALVVICGLVYLRAWRRPTPMTPRPAVASPPQNFGGAPPALEPDPAHRAIQLQRAQLLTWSRDPFLAGRGQAMGELALSGILWDASHPLAMINGATLAVGDEVEGFQVLDIQADHVTLTDGTATYDLRIAP
ncbi:MAG: hypothetical protein HY596_03010 [Candidatus Omnitrophica bacterium]|nr:hypothetical protein [Candidatus Omnitrophota bacterium]